MQVDMCGAIPSTSREKEKKELQTCMQVGGHVWCRTMHEEREKDEHKKVV